MTGGSSRMMRGNVTGIFGGRMGESPSNVRTVNRTRGRLGRLLSQPDPRVVEEVRQDERSRGGPSAPRNSLDLSVVILDESIDNSETSGESLNADFVFEEDSPHEVRDSRNRTERHEETLIREEVFADVQGVPPVSPSLRVVQDVQNDANQFVEGVAVSIAETTIDLTDSPPRIFPPLPSLLSSGVPLRPPRSLPPRDMTDSPPRIFPRPRLLLSEVSSTQSPLTAPQDLPAMLPNRLVRSTRPLTPQRPRYRTFYRSRSNRIESPDTPPRPPRSLSPQPPRPRFLSPQQSNVESPRLTQLVSPPLSMKCPVCLEPFQSIRSRGSNLVSTVCGHVFCGKCLPACVRINGNCPTCRKQIGYEDFHPLYLF